jgi:hypothetical protein
MTRNALLVLVLAAGCSNTKPEERKLQPTATPTPAAPAGSAAGSAAAGSAEAAGSAAAGSAEAAPTMAAPKGTGFAPFDDAMAGTKPWVAADDKAGIVELYVHEDLSERTKGRFTVERKCGADASKIVEAMGKQMAERAKQKHEAPTCKESGGTASCAQPGLSEGDLVLELQYAKAGDAWRVIGARTYGVGMKFDKYEAKYAELLKEKCK